MPPVTKILFGSSFLIKILLRVFLGEALFQISDFLLSGSMISSSLLSILELPIFLNGPHVNQVVPNRGHGEAQQRDAQQQLHPPAADRDARQSSGWPSIPGRALWPQMVQILQMEN